MKKKKKKKRYSTNGPGSDPIVTRAQGKQDPESHLRALPTLASATDAGYGTVNGTPMFCGI